MSTAYLIYCANIPHYPHFPESSLALAGELKKINVDSRIIDLRLERERGIRIKEPLFFGFTIYSNESIRSALLFAEKLRRRFPGVPLVWGGPHVHMLPEQTAFHPLVDIACYGEGELTVRALALQMLQPQRDYHKVPGIAFKEGGTVIKTAPAVFEDLDQLDFYPYGLLNRRLYQRTAQSHFYYQTSRGCIHRCRFCNYNYQSRWRGKSSDRVAEEVTRIIREFHPHELYISDANFFADQKRVLEIMQKLKGRTTAPLRWTAFCRFDDLCAFPDPMLGLMKETGCFKLNMGGESGSDPVLEYLHKGLTVSQIMRGIQRCNEYGIIVDVSFMAGTPEESNEDLRKTLELILTINRLHPDNMVNGLFYYQPYPNTPLLQELLSRYPIPLPRSLEGWGRKPVTAPYREYLPWLSNQRYWKIFALTQIGYLGKREYFPVALI